jgi:hypothetical protein
MFLNPYMLFGAGAIVLPIAIHLLNKQKVKRVRWAAMRFLANAVEQNQRRLNIEDLLLLILRCALVLLLAAALARPALQAAGLLTGFGPSTAGFVIDNSESMCQNDGTQSRFTQAQSIAGDVLHGLPNGSGACVFMGSNISEPLIAEPTYDLNLARSTISDQVRTDRGSDLLPATQDAINALEKSTGKRDLYILTDGQAGAFRQNAALVKLLNDHRTTIHPTVVLVGQMEQENLGISAVKLSSPLAIVDQPLRFDVQVNNYSGAPVRQVSVKLSVDGAAASEEQLIEQIPARGSQIVGLYARFKTEGYHSITATLPGDRFPADDRRSIVVRAVKQVQCLVVDGSAAASPRDAESFYLRNALQPVPSDEREQFFIQVRAISAAELDSTQLNQFDAIFMVDVPQFSDAAMTAMEGYLQQGGGLVFFPGPLTQRATYNDELFKRRRILPATLGEPLGDASSQSVGQSLHAPPYDNPIVSLWNDPGAGTLTAAHFFRVYPLSLDLPAGGSATSRETANAATAAPADVVIRYANGTPAIVERSWSLGRVIEFSSTANTLWNDLPVRPSFIPLLHRTLGALINRQGDLVNIGVGQPFVWSPPRDLIGQSATVTLPPQGKDQPPQEHAPIALVDDHAGLSFDHTAHAGLYSVSAGSNFNLQFATQCDPDESSLQTINGPDLDALKTVADVVQWTPGTALHGAVAATHTSTEYWLPILFCLVALAVTESLLAQRFSRSK